MVTGVNNFIADYRGYRATIGFDQNDKIYVGHVVGTKRPVNFRGKSLEKAEREFHNAVEKYMILSAKEK